MNWPAIAAFAEVVAGVGVVISLVCGSRQLTHPDELVLPKA